MSKQQLNADSQKPGSPTIQTIGNGRMTAKQIGQWVLDLKERMARLHLTEEELAHRSKVPVRTIQRILSGTVKKPHPRTLAALDVAIDFWQMDEAVAKSTTALRTLTDGGLSGLPIVVGWFRCLNVEDQKVVIGALRAMSPA